LASFAFSLYADRPDEHDRVTRVPGSHARTSDAIRRAVASGAPVRVGIIAMGENAARAGATVAYAATLGVAADRIGVDVSHAVGRGTFDPTITRPESLPSGTHRGAPAGAPTDDPEARWRRLGKLAIGPDGTVWPCIFSRWASLGRVGPGRGLADVLAGTSPEPAWRTGCADADANVRLQCAECRVASAALAAVAEGA